MVSATSHPGAAPGRLDFHDAIVERGNRLACWLWTSGYYLAEPIPFFLRGTDEAEARCTALLLQAEHVSRLETKPCLAELIPCLIGLEGRRARLEVGGMRSDFAISRVGDWLPYHVATRSPQDPGMLLAVGSVRLIEVFWEHKRTGQFGYAQPVPSGRG